MNEQIYVAVYSGDTGSEYCRSSYFGTLNQIIYSIECDEESISSYDIYEVSGTPAKIKTTYSVEKVV